VATGGNKRKASEILGIGLKTLYRKIQEFGLQ
jgi:DNA-binding NtrC family response regulator